MILLCGIPSETSLASVADALERRDAQLLLELARAQPENELLARLEVDRVRFGARV
jgi:hypothetical protein